MAKPAPLDNPEYTRILLLILAEVNTNKKLREKLNRSRKIERGRKITSTQPKATATANEAYKEGKEVLENRERANFSAKLRKLKDLGFIFQKGPKDPYYVNFVGILKFILDKVNPEGSKLKSEALKNQFLARLIRLYLMLTIREFRKNPISLNELLQSFIQGLLNTYVLEQFEGAVYDEKTKSGINSKDEFSSPIKQEKISKKNYIYLCWLKFTCWNYFFNNFLMNNYSIIASARARSFTLN